MKYQSKRQEKHKDLFLERIQTALKLGWTQNEMGFWRNPKPPHYGYDTKGMIELMGLQGVFNRGAKLAKQDWNKKEKYEQ